jgi:cytosine/creatinine deaminase
MLVEMEMTDFMRAAIDEARAGLEEGGVPIGAVLVEEGRIIGRGRNRRVQNNDQLMHAEIDCLRNARLTGGYHGTTLYTTLMPCYLCAGAVVQFGITKVVVGESYSAPGAREFLESHGIEVSDLGLEECRHLMDEYINQNKCLWDEFLSEVNPDLVRGCNCSIQSGR